jgi:hypothetical protein
MHDPNIRDERRSFIYSVQLYLIRPVGAGDCDDIRRGAVPLGCTTGHTPPFFVSTAWRSILSHMVLSPEPDLGVSLVLGP